MPDYDKPPELYEGLRLHQNENTAGCSPRVTAALARLRPDQVSVYPPYSRAVDACARHFGVPPSWLALTNGLDEGIMAAAITRLRQADGSGVPEAIVPQPAFEIFEVDAAVAGGRTVRVAPRPDFSFPLAEVLAAVTERTRIVFVTNPNNPTGTSASTTDVKEIARRLPAGRHRFRRRSLCRLRRGADLHS